VIRGLMTDDEWAIFAPFLTTPCARGGRPPKDHRRKLDGILWICRTGAPWRDLPAEFGDWNAVWRQFRRWCASGVWDLLLQALADSGGELDMLQMLDSTTVRAHRCAAGAKGGFKARLLAARAAVSPPKCICAATRRACRLALC
jgi:transposase